MLSIGRNLTVEQRLEKAVIDIMGNQKYTALAGVLMIGDKRVCKDTPTAYTNGRDEVYGAEFIPKLNDAELRFLVLHECYHKLYRHLTTWLHLFLEDKELANRACDYVINVKLVDDNTDGFATMTGELAEGATIISIVGGIAHRYSTTSRSSGKSRMAPMAPMVRELASTNMAGKTLRL